VVADTLSRKNMLLTHLDVKVHGLESLCGLYATDPDLAEPYRLCAHKNAFDKFHLHDRFCFVLTNYVFQNRWSICSCCRNHMPEV
jgi:hypothetical protein